MYPTELDRAWAAGIFDGEGCVSITAYNQTQTRNPQHRMQVSVDMTHEPTILRLQELFGGKVYDRKLPLRKRIWGWHLNGQEARPFLRSIREFSITKRNQVDMALEALAAWGTQLGIRRQRISVETLSLREGYRLALQEAKL